MTLEALTEVCLAATIGAPIQFRPFSAIAFGPDYGWQDMPDPLTSDWSGAEYRKKPSTNEEKPTLEEDAQAKLWAWNRDLRAEVERLRALLIQIRDYDIPDVDVEGYELSEWIDRVLADATPPAAKSNHPSQPQPTNPTQTQ